MSQQTLWAVQGPKGFKLDPRTKLILIFTSGTILITGGQEGWMLWIRPLLAFLPLVLFGLLGRWQAFLKYSLLYTLAYAAEFYLLPNFARHIGFMGFLATGIVGVFTRFLPCWAMGQYVVQTTTVSEFIAAMEKIHMPQGMMISFSVIFRFFPTIKEEFSAISDAMRMRGIQFKSSLKNPLVFLEYRLVPLMISVVKIGEELSAAALARGLGKDKKRTNICRIGFTAFDYLVFVLIVLSWFGKVVS